jgi:hypothetical protein
MFETTTYQDVWIRWVHSTWENNKAWRTDIRPNVLNDAELKKALFILDDGSCVFIPMTELKRVLSQKAPNRNGSVIFNVNPRSKKVDRVSVSMEVKQSKRTKADEEARILEELIA